MIEKINEHPVLLMLISVLIGSVLPAVIGMILPRRKTVSYGMLLYKVSGALLGQKRATQLNISPTIINALITVLRTTFVDLSFGIYIASREDLSEEDRGKKIEEYMVLQERVDDTSDVQKQG